MTAPRAIRPTERNGRTVLFPADILDRLAPHAARRGISANELARRLVEAAADEPVLIDNILDEGGE